MVKPNEKRRKPLFFSYNTALAALSTGVLTLCLVGCAGGDTLEAKSTSGRAPKAAEIPPNEETVRGDTDPPIITLSLGNSLREKRLSKTEDLPSAIIVPTTNLNGVPVTAALQAVLKGTDVALSWDAKSLDNHLVSVSNLSGPLPSVVEKICSAARVFCSYRNGLLDLKEKETFLIELPAVPSKVTSGAISSGSGSSASGSSSSSGSSASSGSAGSATASTTNTMAEAITELSGDKAKVDTHGGNLIYTTDVDGQEAVREYLNQLRNGRPLVVMQLYVWEVTLNKENAAGINWTNFKIPKMGGNWENLAITGSSAFTSVTSPGVSLGAKLSGKLNATSVLQFLSTQGAVQNISSPQLTFVSGADAQFRVGGKQRYVSQVGLSSSNVSGTSSSSTSSTSSTVSTDSIDTGLNISVSGSYEGGVIAANLSMLIQSLIRMDSISTADTQIQLPITTDREVNTMIRVRPGDNLVMAGMISSKDSNSNEAVPLPYIGRLQTRGDDTVENTELVIMVKPSLVLFTDAQVQSDNRSSDSRYQQVGARAGDQQRPLNVLDTSVSQAPAAPIDTIATSFAGSSSQRVAAAPVKTSAQAQSDAGAVDAPVDKGMLQRGFSNIYNDRSSGASRGATNNAGGQ